jgi:hypothetical protein
MHKELKKAALELIAAKFDSHLMAGCKKSCHCDVVPKAQARFDKVADTSTVLELLYERGELRSALERIAVDAMFARECRSIAKEALKDGD